MSVQAGSNAAGRMGATVAGYSAIGMFIEAIVVHSHPWFQPGVVTAATATLLAALQSFILGWRKARTSQEEESVVQ